ncbi:hypothetical protein BASA81_012810 [Batrachochytrium salamandrivorans]|nr:hypothetical protein BASA81_012810 [Batrachochytrium salamandrivorans]
MPKPAVPTPVGAIISPRMPATSHFPIQWSFDPSSGLMVLSASLQAKHNQRVLDKIQQEEDQCSWRAKTRMKTFGIVCVLCLNLGTPPPGEAKVAPHAITECGVDPSRYQFEHLSVARDKIVLQLEQQYREFQGPKMRLKMCPDPVMEDVMGSLSLMRKNALGGRVVLHYNGHGVPVPTLRGEVWVYNDEFSQYIPIHTSDLADWAGSPSVFVFDSHNAGVLLPFFQAEVDRKSQDSTKPSKPSSNAKPSSQRNFLVLCACGADEFLPTAPTLPADLFTSCLTVPVPTALKWFISQHPTQMQAFGIEQRMVDFIPDGESRKYMKRELEWILNTLTDMIAYSVFPPRLFQRLFREDVSMSDLFRNFLLAERIFRWSGRKPCTLPPLPETWKHMLWESWDYTVERSLMQLPHLIPGEILQQEGFHKALAVLQSHKIYYNPSFPSWLSTYQESRFFRDQLLAFENWLTVFPVPATTVPPLQLPVILRLVISKQHRSQALGLLAQFLDQSPQAISQALAVGLFPYILKSLKTITASAPTPTSSPPPLLASSPSNAKNVNGTVGLEEDSLDDLKTKLLRICVRIITFQPLLTRELFGFASFFVGELKTTEEFSMPSLACFVLGMICKLQDDNVKNSLLALDMDRIVAMHIQPMADGYSASSGRESGQGEGEDGVFTSDDDGEEDEEEEEDDKDNEATRMGSEEDDIFVLGESPTSSKRHHRRMFSESQPRRKPNSTLIVWSCLLLARFWQNGFEPGKSRAHSFHIVRNLERLLTTHVDCTVREAAAHALGMLFGSPLLQVTTPPTVASLNSMEDLGFHQQQSSQPQTSIVMLECDLALRLLKAAKNDASPLVRREILFAASRFVLDGKHIDAFRFTIYVLSDFMGDGGGGQQQQQSPSYSQLIDRLNQLIGFEREMFGQKYMAIWMDLSLVFTVDPFPALSQTAQILVGKVKAVADHKWAELRQQRTVLSTTTNGGDGGLLESDLFGRSQYLLARPLKEVEEERFRNQMKAWETKKQNEDAQKTEFTWGRETYFFVNSMEDLASCDWYGEEGREQFAGGDCKTLVKAPFVRLFRQSSHGSGGGMGTAASLLGTAASSVTSTSSSALGIKNSPSGIRPQPDTVRRFDQLPSDVFDSTSLTKLKRSTTNLPEMMVRQSSMGSLHPKIVSSPNLLPMVQLAKQASTSSIGTAFATKSIQSSPPRTGGRQFVELDRIEFAKTTPSNPTGTGTPSANAVNAASTIALDKPHQHFTSSFHPYTPHFLLANETTISVFEAENFRQPISVFSNFNLLSQINALTWIDSTSAAPLLLVSTDDGQCRVWRDVTSPTPKLASAFSPTAGKQNDFQVDWLPCSSHLVCVSANTLRTWDLVSELPSWDCELDCTVTGLSASEHSCVFVAGFSNGSVRMFDQRVGGAFGVLATSSPSNWSTSQAGVNVVSKLSRNMCFATSTKSGEMRIWEARKGLLTPRQRFELDPGTCKVSFHENAPLFACAPKLGFRAPTARVMSFDGVDLSAPICVHLPSPGKRITAQTSASSSLSAGSSSILSLGWHPRELALSSVSQDGASVFVYANTNVRGVWTPSNFEPDPYRL